MVLAVDARWMVGQFRGMGRYAHALLEPKRASVKAFLPEGYPSSVYDTEQFGNGFFPYWEQKVLPDMCTKHAATQLLCPYNTAPLSLSDKTSLILVVHDLIYLEPWSKLAPSISPYQTLGRLYRRAIVPRAMKRANRLVTVSYYTRDQISERFRIPENDITVIPNSLPDDWFVEVAHPSTQRGNYVLAVGGEAPSKNLRALIVAFAAFLARNKRMKTLPQLRIVGVKSTHHAHFERIAEKAGISAYVKFESFLREDELKDLYRNADIFVMPSLFEGFGIPLLEAMASGTPVVCSNTTSLPEIVGEAAWLFNPRDTQDMAEKIYSAWNDLKGRSERAVKGLQRAERYRNKTIASSIENFWKNL